MDLEQVESMTLNHYDTHAKSFFAGTIDHDVSQNYDAFLSSMEKEKPLDILDFGCGPGRDLHYFSSCGHNPVGLDGSIEFCKIARVYSKCEVLHQSFLDLKLNKASYDGVFANASMFHIPSSQLTPVLKTLHNALRPDGILFMSNPRGNGEGWSGQRFGNYMEFEIIKSHLDDASFTVLNYYYRPEGMPINQQPWLAVVCKRQ